MDNVEIVDDLAHGFLVDDEVEDAYVVNADDVLGKLVVFSNNI